MRGALANLVYTNEPWEIDLGRRELRARGAPVAIGNRAFEIVEVLAQAGGGLVSKDDLMERIWPGAVVSENTLHVHIAAVRKALGADRGLLKTLPGRGYRLLGDWAVQRGAAVAAPLPALPGPSAAEPPTNVPAAAAGLFGRAGAVRRVRDLVSAYRVVTLTGAGGIGKTSLAVEAVRGLRGDFGHGTWVAELAALSDPALAPSAVAGALQLKLGGERITAEAVARALGARQVLLVLDNCEHLIDAVADLVETIMRLCPRAAVLATSREVMRIQGEVVYRVPTLDVPAAGDAAPEVILAHSAVELFVARAKALDAGFAPQPDDLPVIAEICRHLDGIALAIEFAAARAAFLGTGPVLAGLRDRFALLTSGRRTAVPRHRTLRAALDWSYRLLSRDEQRLLRRLAVFPAGFTFEAAQAVGDDGGPGASILAGLSSLVAKSLCEHVAAPQPRWRLLETIRAFALEELAAGGEHGVAARRHAAYFRDLVVPVAAAAGGWLGRDDVVRCSREIDNVRAALDWAFSPGGDDRIGAQLTTAFAPIWDSLALMGECRDRVERMLAVRPPDPQAPAPGEWRMWIAFGHALTMTSGPVDRARAAIDRACGLIAAFDDVDLQAGVLYGLWSVEFMSGHQDAALAAVRELAAVAARGTEVLRLAADRILGTSLLYTGQLADAQRHLQRVIDRYAAPSDGYHPLLFVYDPQVLSRARLALVLALRGQLDRAGAAARAAFEAARSSGAGITVCWVLHDAVCPIAVLTGDLPAAEAGAAAMEDWAARMNARLWRRLATCWKGRLAIERGDFARGIEILAPPLEECERTGWQLGYAAFAASLAVGLAGLGRVEEAFARLQHARLWAERTGEAWCQPELARIQGELLQLQARVAEAEACLRDAAGLAAAQGALLWELRIALGRARLRLAHGRGDEVPSLLAPVHARFTEGFDSPDLRAARALLGGPPP